MIDTVNRIELDVVTLWGPRPDRHDVKAYILDPDTGLWEPLTQPAADRFGVFAVDGKVTVVVGRDQTWPGCSIRPLQAGGSIWIHDDSSIRVTPEIVAAALRSSAAPRPSQIMWSATADEARRLSAAMQTGGG